MHISHNHSIPTLEYRCHTCKTHHSKEDIPTEQKQANLAHCTHCGSTFGISYSGDSIITIAA